MSKFLNRFNFITLQSTYVDFYENYNFIRGKYKTAKFYVLGIHKYNFTFVETKEYENFVNFINWISKILQYNSWDFRIQNKELFESFSFYDIIKKYIKYFPLDDIDLPSFSFKGNNFLLESKYIGTSDNISFLFRLQKDNNNSNLTVFQKYNDSLLWNVFEKLTPEQTDILFAIVYQAVKNLLFNFDIKEKYPVFQPLFKLTDFRLHKAYEDLIFTEKEKLILELNNFYLRKI